MVAILAALAVSYAMTRRLPVMALVSAVVVVVFGGLTLFLQDELFIKLKPTIIYLLFAAVLFGGMIFSKPLLAMVFDQVFHLTDEGWRKLTMRWALFFLVLAVLNEIVWRTQSTDTWVDVQGVRRDAADLRVRDAAISAADEIRHEPEELTFAHDLSRKPVSTFRGHALAAVLQHAVRCSRNSPAARSPLGRFEIHNAEHRGVQRVLQFGAVEPARRRKAGSRCPSACRSRSIRPDCRRCGTGRLPSARVPAGVIRSSEISLCDAFLTGRPAASYHQFYCAASAFSIAGLSAVSRLRGVIGPTSL